MKIAVFVDQFPVRSQTFVTNQVFDLLDLGCDVTVIALYKGKMTKDLHDKFADYQLDKKTIYLLNEPKNVFLKLLVRAWYSFLGGIFQKKRHTIINSFSSDFGRHGKSLLLSSIISRLKNTLEFDVILAHFGFNGVLANKLRQLGAINGKIATIFHGNELSDHTALNRYQKEYQKLFELTELMLPISELWRLKLVSLGCNDKKLLVHRMGVNLADFPFIKSKNLPLESNYNRKSSVTLFSVCRFTEKKGLQYAIESLALLPKDISVNYIIGGYGELEAELIRLVERLALSDLVSFVGALSPQQVKQYMQQADVVLVPSVTAVNGDMEGVPVTIMEAMAIGTPVLSTYHSGIPELLTDGVTGLLVQEKDANAIAAKLMDLINSDAGVIDTMICNARHRVEEMADNKSLTITLAERLKHL